MMSCHELENWPESVNRRCKKRVTDEQSYGRKKKKKLCCPERKMLYIEINESKKQEK